MKNLVNCTPREFLMQANKIRHSVEKWLKITDFVALRETRAKLTPITSDMDEETRQKIADENKALVRAQSYKNLSAILDKALEEYPDETLEMLALMCFVEPADINQYSAITYIKEFTEMLANEDVLDFFSSLMRLAQTDLMKA